jgi:uncharacterized LabA/DUF88 family protein
MDLLYNGDFDGFCIVSSDSDVMRLAIRIREQNLPCYVFGGIKTQERFRRACTRFVYREPEMRRSQCRITREDEALASHE